MAAAHHWSDYYRHHGRHMFRRSLDLPLAKRGGFLLDCPWMDWRLIWRTTVLHCQPDSLVGTSNRLWLDYMGTPARHWLDIAPFSRNWTLTWQTHPIRSASSNG